MKVEIGSAMLFVSEKMVELEKNGVMFVWMGGFEPIRFLSKNSTILTGFYVSYASAADQKKNLGDMSGCQVTYRTRYFCGFLSRFHRLHTFHSRMGSENSVKLA